MRKSIMQKLILLIMLLGCLLGALSITSFSAEPTKEQVLIDLSTEWRYLDDDTDPAAGLGSLTAWTTKDFDGDNTTAELADGNLVLDVIHTQPPNGKAITFQMQYDVNGLETLYEAEEA